MITAPVPDPSQANLVAALCAVPAASAGLQPRGWWYTRAARLALKPRKRKIAPQTRSAVGVIHDAHVVCGANVVATSNATPITAIIPPTTDIHRRWRAWLAATAAW